MPFSLRSTALAVVLLAAGASGAYAATQTRSTITPTPRTMSGQQSQVIPISGRGADDERGKATFTYEFDQSVDIQVQVNGTALQGAAFAGGTTDNVGTTVEFSLADGSPIDLRDESNTVAVSYKDAEATGGFAAATTQNTFVLFVDNQVPNAPGDFSADGADETVIVKWDAPTKTAAIEVIDGFIVTYSTTDFSTMTTEQAAALPSKRATTVGDKELIIDGLENGKTYYVSVRSVDWVDNVSDFPRAATGSGIKVVQAVPVRTVTLAELAGEEGGCFIATAAFGSYQEPHVMLLRQFRDEILLQSAAGSRFVEWYYAVSPKYAAWIAAHDNVRAVVRTLLLPLYGAAYLVLHPAWLLVAGFALLTLATAGALLRRQVQ